LLNQLPLRSRILVPGANVPDVTLARLLHAVAAEVPAPESLPLAEST
jgi:hypothetical protein